MMPASIGKPQDGTPVNPYVIDCPDPKNCTVPGATLDGEPSAAEGSTPVDPSVIDCPDPKNCTVPLAALGGGSL